MFTKKHKFWYGIKCLIKWVAEFLIGIFVVLISLVEVPVFLIIHPKIFKNNILYVFWHWSFGHTIVGLDYASRLYYPHRISVIYIPNPGSNEYLPFCFEHNMDIFIYRSIIPFNYFCNAPRCRVIRFFLLLVIGLTKNFQLIEQTNIYTTLSLAGDKLLMGNEETGQLEKITDWTGYVRLLRDSIGQKPKLSHRLIAECKNEIIKKHPEFFNKPFVTLLLRTKGEKGGSGFFSTAIRCSGPQENYLEAIKFLTQNGYNVVGTGETKHDFFRSIKSYYSFENINIPKELLNLFLLMNCQLFIGQHSGPFALSDSCGILCLICDSMPYRLGTCRQNDIILFKHLCDRTIGKQLSLVDVFKNHPDLAYGYHFKEKNVSIGPNSSEEILEAVKECHVIIQGKFDLSEEDQKLCDQFKKLFPKNMLIAYTGNRTSLYILRQLKSQLLN